MLMVRLYMHHPSQYSTLCVSSTSSSPFVLSATLHDCLREESSRRNNLFQWGHLVNSITHITVDLSRANQIKYQILLFNVSVTQENVSPRLILLTQHV